MDRPKPCPFCGKTDLLSSGIGDEGDGFFVSCDRCELTMFDKSEAAVLNKWNTRARVGPRAMRVRPGRG